MFSHCFPMLSIAFPRFPRSPRSVVQAQAARSYGPHGGVRPRQAEPCCAIRRAAGAAGGETSSGMALKQWWNNGETMVKHHKLQKHENWSADSGAKEDWWIGSSWTLNGFSERSPVGLKHKKHQKASKSIKKQHGAVQDAEFATGKNHRREFGDMSISFRRQSKCCQLLVASVFLRFRSIAGSEMHFSRRTMGGSAHICFTSAHQVQCYILTHLAPVESRKRKAKAKAQMEMNCELIGQFP